MSILFFQKLASTRNEILQYHLIFVILIILHIPTKGVHLVFSLFHYEKLPFYFKINITSNKKNLPRGPQIIDF